MNCGQGQVHLYGDEVKCPGAILEDEDEAEGFWKAIELQVRRNRGR